MYSAFVRVIPVRCLGSVNTIWITDALNSGYDGVMLMGCKKGDDYQCHFVKGSEMAHYRMSKIDDTLKQLGLETERVRDLRGGDHRHRARAAADQRLCRQDQARSACRPLKGFG
ncbi:MAG: hydrogenase iron-sulfur subunit [Chromatiales bacterium]|nr:hydrogenase iron-sulfur subunit [Chromatiales bacterium]